MMISFFSKFHYKYFCLIFIMNYISADFIFLFFVISVLKNHSIVDYNKKALLMVYYHAIS